MFIKCIGRPPSYFRNVNFTFFTFLMIFSIFFKISLLVLTQSFFLLDITYPIPSTPDHNVFWVTRSCWVKDPLEDPPQWVVRGLPWLPQKKKKFSFIFLRFPTSRMIDRHQQAFFGIFFRDETLEKVDFHLFSTVHIAYPTPVLTTDITGAFKQVSSIFWRIWQLGSWSRYLHQVLYARISLSSGGSPVSESTRP